VPASTLLGTNVGDVAVAKSDPRIIFAGTPYGLYKSTDRGASFRLVNDAGSFHLAVSGGNVVGLAADPSGVAYANNFAAVQRSTDGGKTWYALSAGQPKSHSLFAIGTAGTPYLADSSGGVFVFRLLRERAVGK